MGAKIIACSAKGIAVGEDHPMARLTNREFELVMQFRDEGWSYTKLAEKFEIPRPTIASWCQGRRRTATIEKFRPKPDAARSQRKRRSDRNPSRPRAQAPEMAPAGDVWQVLAQALGAQTGQGCPADLQL